MIVHGTITKKLDDGTEAEAHYMIDTEARSLIQVGGEAEINAEDEELIMFMVNYEDNEGATE